MRKIKHPSLGEVSVIFEVIHKEKHFFLVKANMKKEFTNRISSSYSHIYDRIYREVPASNWEKSVENYYCLWGNTNEPDKMGVTKILTKSGNKPRQNTINKYFLAMVNASENLTFLK